MAHIDRIEQLFGVVIIAYTWAYLVGIAANIKVKAIRVLNNGRRAIRIVMCLDRKYIRWRIRSEKWVNWGKIRWKNYGEQSKTRWKNYDSYLRKTRNSSTAKLSQAEGVKPIWVPSSGWKMPVLSAAVTIPISPASRWKAMPRTTCLKFIRQI